MRRNSVFGIMLTLLLIGMLTLAFEIQPVKATGTIYIRADGSIDPPTVPIQRDGDVYTFTGNIYDESIVVQRDNIVIDGNGYTLQGPGTGWGFEVSYRSNVTIKSTVIKQFWGGISVHGSTSTTLSENTVTNNEWVGLSIGYSSINALSGNNVAESEYGIVLGASDNSVLKDNNMTNNQYNFGVDGRYLSDFFNDIDTSNTVDGKPIYYLTNQINLIIDSSAFPDVGYLALVNSTNIMVKDLPYQQNNLQGLLLAYVTDSSVENVDVITNYYGIWLWHSDGNTITGNTVANNMHGIYLKNSYGNAITGNIVTDNGDGIVLLYSDDNKIRENTMANNYYGMGLTESSNNIIYHNNFLGNTKQAESYSGSINTWDDGYPSGGNYWSDYVGVDVKSGLGQDLPGSDGIGDLPYIIDADNVDHYPLMNPYGAPPPPTYTLTISATVGGTTDPAPRTYNYTANSTVQVTAIPNIGYLFDYWELDSANVGSANPYTVLMDQNHTLKAVFSPIPPPLSVFISPLSASINVGQSVTFTSTVSGGYTPYSYQWYLNGNPVSGATSKTWTFTPTTSGIYYVYLKVTDAKGNAAQSETARITVATVPVGGYSLPIQVQTKTEPIIPYIALTAILTAIFVNVKRKTKRKR